MSLRIITAPDLEPVSLADAKLHLHETGTDQDALISGLIAAAREMAEHEMGRSIITQTWEKSLDMFPDAIQLPPVASIVSVKFLDSDGMEQTLSPSSYTLDNASDSASSWLTPAYGYGWPVTYQDVNAVRVRYVAGWPDAASVPQSIKQWILLNVGHWYANREAASDVKREPLPFIGSLLDRYRIWSL